MLVAFRPALLAVFVGISGPPSSADARASQRPGDDAQPPPASVGVEETTEHAPETVEHAPREREGPRPNDAGTTEREAGREASAPGGTNPSAARDAAPPAPALPAGDAAAASSLPEDPAPGDAARPSLPPGPSPLGEPQLGEPQLGEPNLTPAGLPDLRVRLEIDLPLTLGLASVFFVTEGLKGRIAPARCRWCRPSAGARSIVDGLRWRDPAAAALTSDVVAYGALPALALTVTLVGLGTEGEWRRTHEDFLVALEAVALTAALTNTLKFTTGRQRPYAHRAALAGAAPSFAADSDQNLSFISGHTSLAFSLATGFATVASLRKRKLAPVLWALGVPAAAFVGYLRIAGDRHWFGDVLAGAAVGTLAGVGLPWLLHHPRTGVVPRSQRRRAGRRGELRLLPTAGGLVVSGRL